MVSNTVTLPHTRKLRGRPLGLTWLGCIVGSWVIAYGFARVVIAIAHVVGAWLS